MKKLIFVVSLALVSAVAFASERYVGKVTVKDGPVGYPMRSCEAPRDQVLRSLVLEVTENGLDLTRVSVRLEDSAGRSEMIPVAVRAGIYPVGSKIRLSVPGNTRCVQNVLIVGKSQGARDFNLRTRGRHGSRHHRIQRMIRPSVVQVYGDVVIR